MEMPLTGMQITHCWEIEREKSEAFARKFGCEPVKNFDDMVGKVDAVISGGYYNHPWNHILHEPYLKAGIPNLVNRAFSNSRAKARKMIDLAKKHGDGYTLFLQDITTHAINASLYRKLPYDSLKDFTPITLIAATPLMLLVHPSLPARSVQELVALAKKRPNEIAHGSSGNGTILHLAAELLKTMSGIQMIHVPYKGSPQAVAGLLSGEVALSFSTMPPALPNVRAGKLRALAVTTPQRSPAAPAVPTMQEAGLPQFELVLYSGILAPRGVPSAIVDKLNAQIAKVVRMPQLDKVYKTVGAVVVTNTPQAFATHISAEVAKLGKLVQISGARID
jgi:tripartite-type tricarboxylate transporter receptor subunit TctC